MLPQMMPLPWFSLFFFLFLSIFTTFLLISSSYMTMLANKKMLKISTVLMSW